MWSVVTRPTVDCVPSARIVFFDGGAIDAIADATVGYCHCINGKHFVQMKRMFFFRFLRPSSTASVVGVRTQTKFLKAIKNTHWPMEHANTLVPATRTRRNECIGGILNCIWMYERHWYQVFWYWSVVESNAVEVEMKFDYTVFGCMNVQAQWTIGHPCGGSGAAKTH